MRFIKKASVKIIFFILLIFLLFTNCELDSLFDPVQTSNNPKSNKTSGYSSSVLYVLNTLSENVTKINLFNFSVENNFLQTGQWANDIKYKNNKLYIVNSGNYNIQITSLDNSVSTYIDISSYGMPEYIEFLNNEKFYISVNNWVGDSKILLININGTIEKEIISTAPNPWSMRIIDNKLYVPCYGTYYGFLNPANYSDSGLMVINTSDNSIITTITGFTNAHQITFNNNYAYLVCTGQYNDTGKVYKINLNDYSIEKIINIGGSPGNIGFHYPDKLFITDNGWTTYGLYFIQNDNIKNDFSNSLIASGMSGMLLNNNLIEGYFLDYSADKLYIYNTETLSIIKSFNIGDGPIALTKQEL